MWLGGGGESESNGHAAAFCQDQKGWSYVGEKGNHDVISCLFLPNFSGLTKKIHF